MPSASRGLLISINSDALCFVMRVRRRSATIGFLNESPWRNRPPAKSDVFLSASNVFFCVGLGLTFAVCVACGLQARRSEWALSRGLSRTRSSGSIKRDLLQSTTEASSRASNPPCGGPPHTYTPHPLLHSALLSIRMQSTLTPPPSDSSRRLPVQYLPLPPPPSPRVATATLNT